MDPPATDLGLSGLALQYANLQKLSDSTSRHANAASMPIRNLMQSVRALQDKVSFQEPLDGGLFRSHPRDSQGDEGHEACGKAVWQDAVSAATRGGTQECDRFQVDADCPGPWLRTWVEFQVDARVNAAFRELAQGDYGGLSLAKQASTDVRGVLSRLEMEVGDVSKSQTKLRTVVQGLADELEDVREAGIAASADLKDVHLVKQELARHEGNLTDLRQTLREVNSVQRRSMVEVETMRSALSETQEEVGGLAVLAERLEQCLAQCHDQVAAAASEVAQGSLSPVAAQTQDTTVSMAAVDGLQQHLTRFAAVQAELESRIEELQHQLDAGVTAEHVRRHLQAAVAQLPERSELDAVTKRITSLDSLVKKDMESLRIALEQELTAAQKKISSELRLELRSSLRSEDMSFSMAAVDGLQQHLTRSAAVQAELEERTEELQRQLHAGVTAEHVRRHLQAAVAQLPERSELDAVTKRIDNLDSLVKKDMESLRTSLEQELAAAQKKTSSELRLELRSSLRSEDASVSMTAVDGLQEHLEQGFAAVQAELEERTEELQRQLDAGVTAEHVRRNLQAAVAQLPERSELDAVTKRIDSLDSSVKKNTESWRTMLEQELTAAQKKTSSELRLELRSSLRSEAAAVAALDEQLWLTDQRLGQRIEELWTYHAALREQLGQAAPQGVRQPKADVVAERAQRRAPTLETIPEASVSQPAPAIEKDELANAEAPPAVAPAQTAEPPSRMVVTQSTINPGLSHDHSDRQNRSSRVRFADAPDIQTVPASESTDEETEPQAVTARPPAEHSASGTKFELSQDLIAERRASRGAPPLSAAADGQRSAVAHQSEGKHGQSVDGQSEARCGTIGSLTMGSPADRAAAIAAARARLRVPNLRPRTPGEKEVPEQEKPASESSVQAATLGG